MGFSRHGRIIRGVYPTIRVSATVVEKLHSEMPRVSFGGQNTTGVASFLSVTGFPLDRNGVPESHV